MGISQAGDIGKKLVTITTPVLNTLSPSSAIVGSSVTLSGNPFGGGGGSGRLVLDGNPIQTSSWTNTQITFTVPQQYPDAGATWGSLPRVVRIGVDLGGGTCGNEVTLPIVPSSTSSAASQSV
jgi:hypothetical protein